MFDKDYCKKMYESGHKNLALSLASIFYIKNKLEENKNNFFNSTNKKKTSKVLRFILDYIVSLIIILNAIKFETVILKKLMVNIEEYFNSKNYAEEIIDYDEFNLNYAERLNKYNLSDLELIMTLMEDMKRCYTYEDSYLEISGYWRIQLKEYGKGVCINYADDFVHKINTINPSYNARNISNLFTYGENPFEGLKEDIKTGAIIPATIMGNHAVVALDIKDGAYTLVLDPTNYKIVGLFVGGKIISFDANYSYDYKYLGDWVYYDASLWEYISDIVDTEYFSEEEFEQIKGEYSKEKQEHALNSAKLKRVKYYLPDEDYSDIL